MCVCERERGGAQNCERAKGRGGKQLCGNAQNLAQICLGRERAKYRTKWVLENLSVSPFCTHMYTSVPAENTDTNTHVK